jgi:mannosylglycerate hydrolase
MTRWVAVVPHTHWDREWYEGFSSYRARLVEMLSGLLDRMEGDPGFGHMMLDGQMALVDDHLAIRPGDEARIRALVGAGRLSVGPWYTLMDEFLVSGETIVRNLQLGLARAASFGGHLRSGYLPDMFGHIGQMPQLLRLAGLEHAVVWRGVPASVNRTAFWWRAPDGSTVRAEYLPTGYGNGASVPDDPTALARRLRAHEAQLGAFLAPGAPLLFMNGTDHQSPQPWLPKVVGALNAAQGDFEVSITGLEAYLAAAPAEGLPSWTGELRSGARANLLMGVASNRVDVKVAAAVAERSLERLAEPLAALWLPPAKWPAALLDDAWLHLVRNSAHDSICACSADEVVLAVRHRYAEATATAREVVRSVHRHLAGAFAAAGPVAVNPGAAPLGGIVELVVPGPAPGGAQVLDEVEETVTERQGHGRDLGRLLAELTEEGWLDDGQATSASVASSAAGVELTLVADRSADDDRSLRQLDSAMAEAAAEAGAHADDPLRVRVERRAATRLLAAVDAVPGFGWAAVDPAAPTGRQAVRGGDNWMDNGLVHVAVSPADGTLSVNGLAGLDRLVDGGDAGDTYNYSPPDEDIVVSRPDAVAVSLAEGGPLRARLRLLRSFTWPSRLEGGRRVGSEAVEVTTTVELRAGEPIVRISASLDNRARDHRLRSVFPVARRASHSEAECAFGTVTRALTAEGGPGEAGLPTYPSRRWVRAGGVTLVHEGLDEYEVVDDGWAVALTLLRCTGILSRPAPALRPNAAGPPTPVPGAQLPGPQQFRYAVAVGEVDPWRMADAVWTPPLVVAGRGGGALPGRGSHLQVRGAEVSSLRRSEGALELRVFNPTDEPAVVVVDGRSGWIVDLTGAVLDPWSGSFVLPPHGIATARLEP